MSSPERLEGATIWRVINMWVEVKENWFGDTGFDAFRVPVEVDGNSRVFGCSLVLEVDDKMREIWKKKKSIERHGLQKYYCQVGPGKWRYRQFCLKRKSGVMLVDDRGLSTCGDPQRDYDVEPGSRDSPFAFVEFYDVRWRDYFKRTLLMPVNQEEVAHIGWEEYLDLSLEWEKIEPKPKKVIRWKEFSQEFSKYLMDDDERAVRTIDAVQPMGAGSPVGTLHDGILEEARKCDQFRQLQVMINPDPSALNPCSWILNDGEKIAVVEGLNRPKMLRLRNTLESAQSLACKNALTGEELVLGQVYQYMIHANVTYAVVTTHNRWVFLNLRQKGAGDLVLRVSNTFHCDAKGRSLFQAIFYFLDLAWRNKDCKIHFGWAETETGRKRKCESSIVVNRAKRRKRASGPRAIVTRSMRRRRKQSGRLPWLPSDVGWKLSGYEIHRLTRKEIGAGAGGGCFRGEIDGVSVVIKICDRVNNDWGAEMMENEVKMYEVLKDLQGEVIPEFFHYEEYGILKVMLISYVEGTTYDMKNDPCRILVKKAVTQIGRIHKLNVEHLDLEKRNIIVRYSPPQVWFIDFGLTSSESNEQSRRRQIDRLIWELTDTQWHASLRGTEYP